MENLAYKLTKCAPGGSERFGPCEVCGKNTNCTFLLTKIRAYQKTNGQHSLRYLENTFGCFECLSKKTFEKRMGPLGSG